MKVKRRLLSGLLCVLFVFCSVFATAIVFNVAASAQTDYNCSSMPTIENDTFYCGGADGIYVSLESTKVHFSDNENIIATYYVNSEDYITDISYTQNGFTVISAKIDSNDSNRIVVELSCIPTSTTYSMSIQINLSSDNTLTAMLYAISNEYGTFISPFSIDDARQRYFDYAKESNLMTQDEYETIAAELSRIDVVEDEVIERPSTNSGGITTFATTSSETYVRGALQWTDDAGNNHPLRCVMIQIYDKESIGSTHLATVYADNDGNYSYTFDNLDGFWDFENGGNDIFIRVYAGTNNAMVQNSSGEDYYYESSVSENVTIGTTVTKNLTIGMSTDKGRAFQISQAILTARDYAWNMMGEMPEDVTIRYPYGSGCYYESWKNRITITGNARNNTSVPNSYASWDVIMHEYGHHISYQLDIIDSPGGSHTFNSNLSDARGNKHDGVRLAWSEAWPTVFAMQAQNYWGSYLQNIAAINDTTYDAYNFWSPYPIEKNTDRLGDGCEVSIIAVLWDLYDSANETNDTISLGYKNYWNVTTGNQSKTFSDFIGYFYDTYPSYIDDIGTNLTYYRMATTKPYISNSSSVSQTVPPKFSWTAQGGSSSFPNNSFFLIFYNSSGTEILRTTTTTSNTYTLTQSEWNSVLYSYGKTYTVAVAATQTDSPTTGEYISARSNVYEKSGNLYFWNHLDYTILANNEIRIDGLKADFVGDLQIPEEYYDKIVTQILSSAFSGDRNLTSVSIPATVTSIGVHAFADCSNLQSVTFAENSQLINIDYQAFLDCSSLESIEIPAGVTSITTGMLRRCTSLKSVTFASGSQLTNIEQNAFTGCTSLTKISLPATVTSIGNQAFSSCTNLEKVVIYNQNNVVQIGTSCFVSNPKLKIYVSNELFDNYLASPYWDAYEGKLEVAYFDEFGAYICGDDVETISMEDYIYCETLYKTDWEEDGFLTDQMAIIGFNLSEYFAHCYLDYYSNAVFSCSLKIEVEQQSGRVLLFDGERNYVCEGEIENGILTIPFTEIWNDSREFYLFPEEGSVDIIEFVPEDVSLEVTYKEYL